MQHLEVSCAVRRFFNSLDFKGLMLSSHLRLGLQSVLPLFFGFPDQNRHMTTANDISCCHDLCSYNYILAADWSINTKLGIETATKNHKRLWLGNLLQKTASRPDRIRG